MRITRSASFIAKQLTATVLRTSISSALTLSVLAAGVLVGQNLFSTPNQAHAATPPDSCFAFTSGTGTITDYYDNEGNNPSNPACPRAVDIPSTIGGVAVTTIGNAGYPGAFSFKVLTSVTIPSSVTSIGDYAFYGNQLTSLTIAGNPTTIGSGIFSSNKVPIQSISYNGTTYTAPTGQQTPPDSCFSFSTGTITGHKYADLAYIKANGSACLATDIAIPSTIGGTSVTSIGDSAFSGNQLTSLTIPSSVTSIGDSAFSGNQLTSLTIPSSVTSIGDYAFAYNQLTTVTIPSNLTTIQGGTFQDNQLTSVTIPTSVTNIEYQAFYGNQLTSLTIPSSVTIIGDSAFRNNTLTDVTIVGNPTTIEDSALSTGSIETISYNGRNYSRDLPLPDGCWDFDSGLLSGIDDSWSLADLQAGGDACISNATALTIPSMISGEAVTAIDEYAFYGNQLTSVTIPSSVTSIGEGAFYNNNLTTVTLPSSLTSIGEYTFTYNQLTNVTIPSSVTSIEPTAFTLQNPWGREIEDEVPGVPYIYSDDPAIVQQAYDAIWYVRLYTVDPANPNNIQDGILSEDWWQGYDANDNGTTTDSLGGHLINPARTTVNTYGRTGTTALYTAQLFTGTKTAENGGGALRDYQVTAAGSFAPLDPEDPTPEEQTAMDTGFAQYHRIGQTKEFTAPTVSGYTRLSPASPVAKELTAPENSVNFRYAKSLSAVDFTKPSGSTSNPTPMSVPAGSPAILKDSTFTLDDSMPCSVIESAKLLPASHFEAPVADQTTIGGLDFSIACSEPGKDASISFTLGGTLQHPDQAKVYKKTTSGTTDITSQVTISNVAGKTVITYNLTDGGALDDDKTVNGIITDPIYVTIPTADATGLLAATGTSVVLYASLAGMLMVLGGITTVYTIRKN